MVGSGIGNCQVSEWPTSEVIQTQTVEQLKQNFKFSKIKQWSNGSHVYNLQFFLKNGTSSPVFGNLATNQEVSFAENTAIRQVVVYNNGSWLRGITFNGDNNSTICEVKGDNAG